MDGAHPSTLAALTLGKQLPNSQIERRAEKVIGIISKPSLLVPLLTLLVFSITTQYRVADPDLFARLAVGRLVFTEGRLPWKDPFSFTSDKSWIDHEWLSGCVFYLSYSLGGDAALVLLKFLSIFSTLGLMYLAHSVYGRLPLLFSFGTLQCLSIWMSTVRSQVFTYLSLAYLLLALSRYDRLGNRRLLYTIPLLMVPWCNAHGGFVSGLGILGAFVVGKFLEKDNGCLFLFSTLALSLVATVITPYGPAAYWSYILDAVFKRRPNIDEWEAVNLLSGETIIPLIFLGLIASAIAWQGIRRRYSSLLVILVSLIFGFRHVRLMPIFIFSCLTLGNGFLTPFISRASPYQLKRIRVPALTALVIGVLVTSLLMVRNGKDVFVLDRSPYPTQALDWLKQNYETGRLLVDFNSGSFALWNLYPGLLVSMDGRYEELYSDKVVYRNAHALSNSSTRIKSVKAIDPDFILIDKREVDDHDYGQGWEKQYEDALFLLLVKSERSKTG